MAFDTSALEKDIKVGDLVRYVSTEWMHLGRCIANNGKTLKFEALVPTKELQIKYGRELDHRGMMTRYGNWRIDIPYMGNEESFYVAKEVIKRRISKKGYHMFVVTLAEATHIRVGDDPNWN